jgi:hypothetical protein
MTSILKVDTIQDIDGNNIINESSDTITIGASGDTITIPSGATLSNLGTASGFVGANEAKAWVNFNGTGAVAIRASFNVTSITDNGTGNYTVNLTTAMPDVNYCAVGSGALNSTVGSDINNAYNLAPTTTTTITCKSRNAYTNTAGDVAFYCVIVHR